MQGQMTAPSIPGARPRLSLEASDGQARRRKIVNGIMTTLIGAAALLGVSILGIILGYIIVKGAPALNLDFFTKAPPALGEAGGGVAPAIRGSLLIVGLASLVGIPVGLGAGIYLAEFGRGRFADTVRFIADLMTGLPSIAIGAVAWALLVKRGIGTYNAIAGSVALAIIMIPIITRTTEEILKLVPNNLREASLALGTPRWKTIVSVVLPVARSGILTGVILSVARVSGETAPLLLTVLGNSFASNNLRGPMAALPLEIYQYATKSPFADSFTKAWGASLVLIIIIGLLSLSVRLAARLGGPQARR
ncbi:MAG: Phosphate transport system permease protein PstA [uncultured Thermomicrobiales bacterium]|uniref:Phosphate transport system permease protein PstA n=1 Tax=uncultured Thermomicrobiales bacterium TaxID=1645740 RepID=A0A6J4UQH2_9BACT|nr:MAG: Phosphate transport system permease protein PstA [uncultured Thermomicrobiales bacterium]